jgi:transcription elongation factor Elf1
VAKITRERAERIAKGHVCRQCNEYSFKKLTTKPAPESISKELGAAWIVTRVCGICGSQGEVGIQDDGDIVFES